MYIRIVRQQSFAVRMVEVRAVVHGGLECRGPAENFGLPCVEMGVEVYDADGTVGLVDGAEQGERDSMVASEGDEPRQGLSVFCGADFLCISGGGAHEKAVVTFFDLLDRVGVVVAGNLSVLSSFLCIG